MKIFQQNKLLRKLSFHHLSKPWARKKYQLIKSYLKNSEPIIDIGSGKCAITWLLRKNGYRVIPLDINDLSLAPNIQPIIYDGQTIPFPDNHFKQALLLTVLHHTPHPEQLIQEAARVAQEIIIIEDIYSSLIQKYLTYGMDSLMNFEFIGHPHNNKKEQEWQKIFKKLELEIIDCSKTRTFFYFQQICFYLKLK